MFKFILFFLLLSQAALGTTRYIATTGHDTNNTCAESISVSTPKRNFKGTSGAINCMAAGDTLIVKAGTYIESDIGLTPAFPSGISDSQRTIIQAAAGETVIIRPASGSVSYLRILSRSYITIQDIIFDGTNLSGYGAYIGRQATTDPLSQHIKLIRVEMKDSAQHSGAVIGWNQYGADSSISMIDCKSHGHGTPTSPYSPYGVYVTGRNNLIDGGEYYDNNGMGIHVFSSSGAGANNGTIVRNAKIYNNSVGVLDTANWGGLGIFRGVGIQAYNNIIYDNKTFGIDVNYDCVGCKIYNNTIYSNDGYGVRVRSSGVSGAVVQNNIIHTNSSGNLSDAGSGTITSNNLCGTNCYVNETSAANIFTNAAAFDFTLKAGSPAIGNGANLSAIFTDDYANVTRSVPWDIGAYEYVSVVESLTLNSPNGGENWVKTSPQTISWSRDNFTNTRVRADRDNDGTFEETISASTSGISIGWTPGGSASSTVKIQVCDAGDGTPCDVSNAVFTIADTAGTTITRIISENTVGSFIGDVNGVEETYIWEAQPTTNFSTGGFAANKASAGSHSHGLIKFTGLSQIPSGATVTSVTIGLNLQSVIGAGSLTFDFRKCFRAWLETQATWNIYSTGNNWATAGGLGAGTDRRAIAVAQLPSVGTTLQYYTITDSAGAAGGLLELVRAWVDGSEPINGGFHVERNGTGNDSLGRTWTSSEGTNGNRPWMSVTYSTNASTISVVEPFSDSHFFPGQTVPIRWGSQGVSGNVEVLLSRDGGVNYIETIDASFPFDGSDYAWLVTRGSCSACIIKVISINDPTVFGLSAPFKIAGSAVRAR